MRIRFAIICFSMLVSLVCLNGTVSAAVKAEKSSDTALYTFAVIPYYSPEKIWTLFSPFVEYLNITTKNHWKLALYSNHDEFVEDICNGQISVALAGPIPLGRAYNKCGARPFLAALANSGKPAYRAVFVTSDPMVKELRDLKGRKVGFFKGSTAAHILPVKILKNAKVSLSDIQPVFLDGQDRVVSGLLSGELSAAGMKETLFRKISKENLRIIATSDEVPNFSMAALPAFPQNVRKKLEKSLLALKPLTDMKDAVTVKSWDDEVKNGFIVPDSSFLSSIINMYSIYWEVTNEPR